MDGTERRKGVITERVGVVHNKFEKEQSNERNRKGKKEEKGG